MCDGHVNTLALLIGLTWGLTYGYALGLSIIVSSMPPFAFIIFIVDTFVETKFWTQWITMVNVMTLNTTMFTH